jgi:hypothetical protein
MGTAEGGFVAEEKYENGNGNGTVEIKTPLFSGRFSGKRMAEFISVLSLIALVAIGMGLWQHKEDAHASTTAQTKAFEKMIEVQEQMLQAQREQNCLIAMKPENRSIDFCKRIVR